MARLDDVPSFTDLGIPEGRGGIGVSVGGQTSPSSRHGLELYVFDGELEIDRDVTIRLFRGADVLETQSARVGRLPVTRPF